MLIDTPARSLPRRFLAFLGCFYAAWCVRVAVLLPVDARIESEWLRQCWSQGLRIAIWVVPVFVYLRYVDGVGALSFLRLDTLPRGRRLAQGLGVMAAFLILGAVISLTFQGAKLERLTSLPASQWVISLTTITIAASAEEILYRGFFFRKLREVLSFHRANLYVAGLFVAIHWSGWLYLQGPNWGLLPLSAAVFIVGYVLGFVVEITGSLWPAILLHVLNNVWSMSMRG